MVIQSLRTEFVRLIDRITESFITGPDGKLRVFKNATVENVLEFFETFRSRNIFKNAQLTELVERANETLGGHTTATIRSNDQLKKMMHNDMKEIETAIAEIFERPRRKIILN